mmetsp:Transcript_4290/g.11736  ORF Transcript_4290/g.11736 Transcript_4290/m.11736 type:complete len:537 (-) Transcript_4290:642-2252(-)
MIDANRDTASVEVSCFVGCTSIARRVWRETRVVARANARRQNLGSRYKCVNGLRNPRLVATAVNSEEDTRGRGSIVGATLLVSGCAIGAGMLALPARTAAAGLIPAETVMLAACLYNLISSLLFLEATNNATKTDDSHRAHVSRGAHSESPPMTISRLAEQELAISLPATCILWLMQLSLLEVYIVEGSHLFARLLGTSDTRVCGLAFAGILCGLVCFGKERTIDFANRVLVAGLGASIIAVIALLLATSSAVGIQQLVEGATLPSNWASMWPAGVSVCLVAFQSQCVTPVVHQYMGGDLHRARISIVLGHILPFAMYSAWEFALLRSVDASALSNSSVAALSPVDALFTMIQESGTVSANGIGAYVSTALLLFSICAVGSSLLALGISLRDMILNLVHNSAGPSDGDVERNHRQNVLSAPRLAAFLALSAPAILPSAEGSAICSFVLDRFGLLAGLAINGILPAVVISSQIRKSNAGHRPNRSIPQRIWAQQQTRGRRNSVKVSANAAAAGMGAASLGLLVPESVRMVVEFFAHP